MKYKGLILMGLIGLLFCGAIIYTGTQTKLNGEQIDCYDRYSNKIIGEECIVEGGSDSRTIELIQYSFLGVVFLLLFLTIGYAIDCFKPISFGGF